MLLCLIVTILTTVSSPTEFDTNSLDVDMYPWAVSIQSWFVFKTKDTEFKEGLSELAFVYHEPNICDQIRSLGLKLIEALNNKKTALVSRLASVHEETCTQLALRYMQLLHWQSCTSYISTRMIHKSLTYTVDTEAAVQSLVERADAELGAQVFRDLVLSFALPRGLVGLRHTLLLSRLAQYLATKNHSSIIGHAHQAALQEPSRVWQYGVLHNSSLLQSTETILDSETDKKKGPLRLDEAEERHAENERRHEQRLLNQDAKELAKIERACVVLAGLGMLFASSESEARTGVAFAGRVHLPFLAVPTPDPKTIQSLLVMLNDSSWGYILYENAQPFLAYRGEGLDGLCKGAAMLMYDHANAQQSR